MAMRGVVYMVWGAQVEPMLQRSIASVKAVHPDLPIHVERLPDDPVEHRNLLKKSAVADVSPFESTLFLDADTVVLGPLDYGFEKAERYGLACSICECPWARRYGNIRGDTIEYNTGVVFFTNKARPVFDAWKRLVHTVDSMIVMKIGAETRVMAFNDQGSFAQAIEETGFQPHVLPMNWNFRPVWHQTYFGPIRIWHDYSGVPPTVIERNRRYQHADAVVEYYKFI